MDNRLTTLLIRLSYSAWCLAKQATNAARSEEIPKAELIRCMAETNVAADKLRCETGITCDEIADMEAKLMEEDEDAAGTATR